MKTLSEIKVFDNIATLTKAFVEQLNMLLLKKDKQDFVTLALAGGTTPKALFIEISDKYNDQIDWSRVKIFWSDERCVPPASEDSNYKMTFDNLLKAVPVPEKNIFRIQGENEPENEANRYSEVVKKNVIRAGDTYRFDVIMLGLGNDGHTASIFPGNEGLFESKKLFATARHPETKQQRITMTGALINQSANIIFLVTGAAKAQILSEVVGKKAKPLHHPASLVQPENGKITWMVDREAAKYIDDNSLTN